MISILFVLLSALSFAMPPKSECIENQAAYDFGSGTTKLVIAQVDICQKTLLKAILEHRLPLALNDALEKSSNNEIPLLLLQSNLPELKKWQRDLDLNNVQKTFAVATAVYRKAANSRQVLELLEKQLGISIKLITQDEEAELGYWAAKSQGFSKEKDLVVWDIGGGSMQFYARSNDGKMQSFKGDLASVSFKNKVLADLFYSPPEKRVSPNPLGLQRAAQATRLAQNHAVLKTPAYFKNLKRATWVGIGGVLGFSIQNQVNSASREVLLNDLRATLNRQALKTDTELVGEYKQTDVTNLALVLGYMQALNIELLQTRPVSLGQGLIFRNLNH